MSIISAIVKKSAFIALAVSIVAGLVGAALPTGSVSAAANAAAGASTTQPQAAAKPAPRLERAFKQEQTAQARQGKVLDRADQVAQKAAAAIEKLKKAGKDVSGLEKILAAFKASIDSARLIHDQAAGIIAKHPGFDVNGKVANRTQAQQTVKDVHGLQVQLRQSVWPAIRDLIKAVRDYRQNNKATTPTTPNS